MLEPNELARVNVLGVGISAINMGQALGEIDRWIARKELQYVCVCPVHTVMECQRSKELRRVVNSSGMATPDGMPLVWLAHLAGKSHVGRVYGPDLMLAEMERSSHMGYRHFLYGGMPGVAERLAERLKSRYPGVQIVGTFSPPIASVEDLCTDQVADRINADQPDIVWVGIGSPKQDLWLGSMRPRLKAPVLIAVGAAFDFHSGAIRQAPRWMQRSGLEWLFRLSQDPRRLWRRYFGDNFLFLWHITLQALRIRRYPL